MAHDIGYVDNTGSEGVAHWQMLLKIKTLAEANGWTTLRYLNPTDGSPRELILKGVGLSGTEEIYIGVRAYHSVTADYYNMAVAVFTGYVAANAWENQPGMRDQALCAHNQRIDYWLVVNAQRILLGMKVGTPVYEVGYAGKFYPYATPAQYPYPVAVIGTLGSGMPPTRYSDTSDNHSCGCKGLSNGYLRDLNGAWQQFRTLAWTADYNNAPALRRDTGGYYSALKTVLMTGDPDNPDGSGNVWGELDGLRYVSGFNNLTENTMTLGSVTHVVLQDVFRTGIGDYMLLEMN